jgi:hypothetical protein
LHGLPPPAAAALRPIVTDILGVDRGRIRAGNDGTLDSRGAYFENWCARRGIDNVTLAAAPPKTLSTVIACFVKSVQSGDNLKRLPGLASKTLSGYIAGAVAFLAAMGCPDPCRTQGPGGSLRFVPLISDVLNHQSKWRPERPPKEPITGPMFRSLGARIARDMSLNPAFFLSQESAVFDCLRLGFFTGSRAGELVQTRQRSPFDFATVPRTTAAGEWAGSPLAFIRDDFTFLSRSGQVLSPEADTRLAIRLRLRFRYDKSGRVGQFRTFRRVHSSFLCPVAAAISLLRRASALHTPPSHPVSVYVRSVDQRAAFLSSAQVTRLLRATVVATYPDPTHLARVNVLRFVTHSVRVTACVALWAARFSIDEIVFRLRWNSSAVNRYIRECATAVDDLTIGAAQFAFLSDA